MIAEVIGLGAAIDYVNKWAWMRFVKENRLIGACN